MRLMSLLLFNVLRESSRMSSTAYRLLGTTHVHSFSAHKRISSRQFTVMHDIGHSNLPRSRIAAINTVRVEDIAGTTVKICGWVRTLRVQKANTFIEINDGSTLGGIQAVVSNEHSTIFKELDRLVDLFCLI
jgi:hypothetical protein